MASQMAALIGSRIKEAREAKGLSQKQLGNLLPGIVGGDQVSKWERGAHRPHDDTLDALAAILDVDMAYFMASAAAGDTPDLAVSGESQLDRIERAVTENTARLETIEGLLRELATEELLASLAQRLDQQASRPAGSRAPGRRGQAR